MFRHNRFFDYVAERTLGFGAVRRIAQADVEELRPASRAGNCR